MPQSEELCSARLGPARLGSRGRCLFTPDWFSVSERDGAASRCYKLLCWGLRDGSHACAACSLGEFGRLRFKEVVLEPGWCSSDQRAVLKSSFKLCFSSCGVKILRAILAKVTLYSFILFSPHYHFCRPYRGWELFPLYNGISDVSMWLCDPAPSSPRFPNIFHLSLTKRREFGKGRHHFKGHCKKLLSVLFK